MSLQDRVVSLKEKHASLDQAIRAESKRRYPDNTAIKDLKRQKLRVKDELESIQAH